MGHQDLYTYYYKDDAAKELWLQTVYEGLTEAYAQQISHHTEQEGDNANHHQRIDQLVNVVIARTGEGDANCQGIDARGHRQQQLSAEAERIE